MREPREAGAHPPHAGARCREPLEMCIQYNNTHILETHVNVCGVMCGNVHTFLNMITRGGQEDPALPFGEREHEPK